MAPATGFLATLIDSIASSDPVPTATTTPASADSHTPAGMCGDPKIFRHAGLPNGSTSHRGRFSPSRKPFQGQVKTQENTMRKEKAAFRRPDRFRFPRPCLLPFRFLLPVYRALLLSNDSLARRQTQLHRQLGATKRDSQDFFVFSSVTS